MPPRRADAVGRNWIADDVVRLSLPYPNGYVNVFVVFGADGVGLIDAGHRDRAARRQLWAWLGELGVGPEDVRHVLLTHAHADHVGLLDDLDGDATAPVHVHRLEAEPARAADRIDFAWLRAHGLPASAVTPVASHPPLPGRLRPVEGGDVLEMGPLRLELIWTPGHSPGMLCAYEPRRRWLFSTDQLLRAPTPLWLLAPRPDDPVADYLGGLDALAARDVGLVLPGHGRAFDDVDARIDAARHAHLSVLARMLALLERGARPAIDLARELGWLSRAVGPGGATAHALGRTLVYLQHLERRGRVAFEAGRGWRTA